MDFYRTAEVFNGTGRKPVVQDTTSYCVKVLPGLVTTCATVAEHPSRSVVDLRAETKNKPAVVVWPEDSPRWAEMLT